MASAGDAPAAPRYQRIVSTSPTVTETLFALGLGDRVVGVSTYCRYPAAVAALPKIGTFLRPDVELIARLRPDLVVIHESHTTTSERSMRCRFATSPSNAARWQRLLEHPRHRRRRRCRRSRRRARGDLERQLARVRQASRDVPPKRVLIVVGRRTGALLTRRGRPTARTCTSGRHRRRRQCARRSEAAGISAHLDRNGDPPEARRDYRRRRYG